MNILSAKKRISTFVLISTDVGDFCVYQTGKVERWNDSICDYVKYDEYSTYYDEVKKAAQDFFQGECE
jgi:arginine/lysine/ornithine decarboxylase